MGSDSGKLARVVTPEEKQAQDLERAALLLLGAEMGIAALGVIKKRQEDKIRAVQEALGQKTEIQNTTAGVDE